MSSGMARYSVMYIHEMLHTDFGGDGMYETQHILHLVIEFQTGCVD